MTSKKTIPLYLICLIRYVCLQTSFLAQLERTSVCSDSSRPHLLHYEHVCSKVAVKDSGDGEVNVNDASCSQQHPNVDYLIEFITPLLHLFSRHQLKRYHYYNVSPDT